VILFGVETDLQLLLGYEVQMIRASISPRKSHIFPPKSWMNSLHRSLLLKYLMSVEALKSERRVTVKCFQLIVTGGRFSIGIPLSF